MLDLTLAILATAAMAVALWVAVASLKRELETRDQAAEHGIETKGFTAVLVAYTVFAIFACIGLIVAIAWICICIGG